MSNGGVTRELAALSVVAGEDLTDKVGYAVKLNGSQQAVLQDSDTALDTLGILTSDGKSGEHVTVLLAESGECTRAKCSASPGTINAGDYVGTHTNGTFKVTASTKNAIARALEGGSADAEIEVQLTPQKVTS